MKYFKNKIECCFMLTENDASVDETRRAFDTASFSFSRYNATHNSSMKNLRHSQAIASTTIVSCDQTCIGCTDGRDICPV